MRFHSFPVEQVKPLELRSSSDTNGNGVCTETDVYSNVFAAGLLILPSSFSSPDRALRVDGTQYFQLLYPFSQCVLLEPADSYKDVLSSF